MFVLQEYREKRDFTRTPEPPPQKPAGGGGPPVFVVQKHAARRLHYDLRLEVAGVLKSWAVTAGPSLDPKIKRLAVMVDDHPLTYASFEGIIPAGEYGAGQVIVWDTGDYSPDNEGKLYFNDRARADELMMAGLEKGKLSFFLRGHKLRGSFTLVRMRRGPKDWLLIKHQDDFAGAGPDVLEQGASVLSGLTIEDLKAGRKPAVAAPPVRLADWPGARRAQFPAFVPPMLAESAAAPFSRDGWLFEPKLDGYRTIATVDGDRVRLYSRRGLDVTGNYKGVAEGLRRQAASQLVLDGEIIALDEKGQLCFQCLQGYLEAMQRPDKLEPAEIIYYVFDLLYLDGYELHEVPLASRKNILERTVVPSKQVRLVAHFEGDGEVIYKSAVAQGLEGIMAKKQDSLYLPGRRTADWLKVKSLRTGDFVVGGFTQGTGNRARTFGALLLGYYDGKGRLVPAGNVGTGFDDVTLTDLRQRLDALKVRESPFATAPEIAGPAHWVRPEMVIEVKYTQITRDGRLRVPVFLRPRDDKPAKEVRQPEATIKVADPPSVKAGARREDTLEALLDELKKPKVNLAVKAAGHKIELTNLDKELWPRLGTRPALTKRDLLEYLVLASPYLLAHLRDRPITLSRFPDGINGEHFWQKHWASELPSFVATVALAEHGEKRSQYILCNNLPTLLWLGQVADLEFHSWFSRVTAEPGLKVPGDPGDAAEYLTHYPDFIIFDIDPYIYSGKEKAGDEPELSRKGFAAASEAALWLKEILDGLSLAAFVKTSGRTGLHIFAPVVRRLDFKGVHAASKTICDFVLRRHPDAVTTEWAVAKRRGKVFLDYNQNVRGKTLAAVYSPRPAPEATVSTPLRWDELGKVYATDFTILSLPDRLKAAGDLWADILKSRSDLKVVLGLID